MRGFLEKQAWIYTSFVISTLAAIVQTSLFVIHLLTCTVSKYRGCRQSPHLDPPSPPPPPPQSNPTHPPQHLNIPSNTHKEAHSTSTVQSQTYTKPSDNSSSQPPPHAPPQLQPQSSQSIHSMNIQLSNDLEAYSSTERTCKKKYL